MSDNSLLKSTLRKTALAFRRRLPMNTLQTGILAHLSTSDPILHSTTILLYHPLPGEPDLLALLTQLPGKRFGLPRIDEQDRLRFHSFHAGDALEIHRYGMSEPLPSAPEITPEVGDCLIVPGLMFDFRGYRLGFGKAYYDRYMATLPSGIVKIGVTPDALLLPALPHDPWDIPMDWIVTEKGPVAPKDAVRGS